MTVIPDRSGRSGLDINDGTGRQATTSAVIGEWVPLFSMRSTRRNMFIQNRSTANVFLARSLTKPADGAVAGELHLAPDPVAFEFPTLPGGNWWARADAASANVTVMDT